MTMPRKLLGLASLALVFAPRASAQCQTGTGPDVIVGALTGPANYPALGTLDALSIGTTSCNIGSTWLKWFWSTNEHPVIGGTLYRFTAETNGVTRFEQIGMSWLKHGFFAVSETLCCAACNATDGRHLGVGCSDPYSAPRNGTQSNLGPRFEVNAHTGEFLYPPSSPPMSGTTARRLEVELADLAPTNGTTFRLFAEAMYVTPDDAAAGNQNNNASWREATYNPATESFAFTGPTTRAQAALHAWRSADPSVTIVPAQIAGEGLFLLGYDATHLGGGMWHYEYSLLNQNSDLSGASFTVPIAAGVTVTNVGFRDVAYRNGDGLGNVDFSGADWTVVRTASAVTWSTDVFAANPNANALRWSSTYTFRFDATKAPESGNVLVGLFKDPSAGPLAIAAAVPAVAVNAAAYCFGDGSLATPCPCAPPDTVPSPSGSPSAGCANSFELGGARLVVSGTVDPDTVLARASELPPIGFAFFVAGDADDSSGSPFGDGVQCAGGTLLRFGEQPIAAGAATYPRPGLGLATPVSTVLGVGAGSGTARYLQALYRNAAAGFCSPSTANATNAVRVVW